jgi:hypothetical protein
LDLRENLITQQKVEDLKRELPNCNIRSVW